LRACEDRQTRCERHETKPDKALRLIDHLETIPGRLVKKFSLDVTFARGSTRGYTNGYGWIETRVSGVPSAGDGPL
jgi:hypothetical protein